MGEGGGLGGWDCQHRLIYIRMFVTNVPKLARLGTKFERVKMMAVLIYNHIQSKCTR